MLEQPVLLASARGEIHGMDGCDSDNVDSITRRNISLQPSERFAVQVDFAKIWTDSSILRGLVDHYGLGLQEAVLNRTYYQVVMYLNLETEQFLSRHTFQPSFSCKYKV